MRMIIIQHKKGLRKLLPPYYTAYTLRRKIRVPHKAWYKLFGNPF